MQWDLIEEEDWGLITIYSLKKLGVRGRPKAAVTKERITIRLSREVVETFRATGEGWQTRMDEALQEYVREHRLG